MALDSKHPLYDKHVADWRKMRITYAGERAVKEAGTEYLPPTSGMVFDGMAGPDQPGSKAYAAYKTRAVFPEYVSEAVVDLIGVMHHKPPQFELPPLLKPLEERATHRGESLAMLLRRINEAQLTTGRIGLLLDLPVNVPVGEKALPYIATYDAESIINWDVGRSDDGEVQNLRFAVLNETESERQDNFEWQEIQKYRVLMLEFPVDAAGKPVAGPPVYRAGVFRASGQGAPAFNRDSLQPPVYMGRELNQIPFVVCNATDVVMDPAKPPLLALANVSMTIYRGEADYRQNLFMQGQDTLVVVGGVTTTDDDEDVRVGAGARIDLPLGGSAEYIGVESSGLMEQREALQNDRKEAKAIGGQLLDAQSKAKESGDALKTRVSAQTASLNQVALTGAFALELVLRIAATWMGADPKAVKVSPNLDFDNAPLTGADLLDYVSAKNAGAPLARETIHGLMVAKNVTNLSFEDEMALIEGEKPITVGVTLPIDPNADPEDEEGEDEEEPPFGGGE
jgi:hypothetical protein